MKTILAALVALSFAFPAWAQAPTDNELAEAYDECRHHRQDITKPARLDPAKPLPAGYPMYAVEWAACLDIDKAYIARKAPKDRAESQKRIEDMAKRLPK